MRTYGGFDKVSKFRVCRLIIVISMLVLYELALVIAVNNLNIQVVDSYGNVGKYTSLALDSEGRPHISYLDTPPIMI